MIKQYIIRILTFFFLVFLQVLVFDNMQFSGYVNPYIYILFILLLRFETQKWILLLLAFSLGITIDILSSTPGIHAIATLVMAFCRPYLLVYIAPRNGYEDFVPPRIENYGFGWFLRYTFLMVFIHHMILFYVEAFSFDNFFHTFLRVVLSAFFSITFIVLSQFFIFKK
jgi:rod shape-determining protein MreD